MESVNSLFLRLNLKDVAKGLSVAVIVVVLGMVQQSFKDHGLDVTAFDWAGIMDVAWKTGFAYLVKNYFSDEKGRLFGRIG